MLDAYLHRALNLTVRLGVEWRIVKRAVYAAFGKWDLRQIATR